MVPTNSTPRLRDTRLGASVVRLRDGIIVRHSFDRLLVAVAVTGLLAVTTAQAEVDLTSPLMLVMFGAGALTILGHLTLAMVDELSARRTRTSVALLADLDRLDLHGARLRGMYFRQRSLRSVRLSNADLRRADLAGTDLTDARLTEADLGGANLTGANLAGASLFRIRGNHACFDGADLSGASLDRAGLRNARLHKTCLVQTSLRAADLRGADLREAEFWGADLRGADLRMADLREADLTGANLRGADLRGAKIDGIIAEPSQVRSARGGQNIPVEADDAIRLPTPIIELRPQPEPMTGSTASSEARRRVAAGAMAMGIAAMAVAGVSLLELPSDDVEPAVLNTVQERASLEITGDGAIEIELISADGTELERARLPLDRDLLADRTDVVAVRARSLDGSDLE